MKNQNEKEKNQNNQAGETGNVTNDFEFKQGDKVRFKCGYDKTFGGSDVYTVEKTEKMTCRGCNKEIEKVTLKEFNNAFQGPRLKKEKADKLGGAELWRIIETCLFKKDCQDCTIAGKKEGCLELVFSSMLGIKELFDEDVKAYKREIAVLNSALQSIFLEQDCALCPLKIKCKIVRQGQDKDVMDCISLARSVQELLYDMEPTFLKMELSGELFNKKGGEQ